MERKKDDQSALVTEVANMRQKSFGDLIQSSLQMTPASTLPVFSHRRHPRQEPSAESSQPTELGKMT